MSLLGAGKIHKEGNLDEQLSRLPFTGNFY